MIIVTPYLVQPVNANQIALPTDGLRTANDGERVLLGQEHGSRTGETRPVPRAGPAQVVRPGVETGGGSAAATPAPTQQQAAGGAPARRQTSANSAPQPGFELR